MQAHSLFLQAAGKQRESIAELAQGKIPYDATPGDAELIRFAQRLTASPGEFRREHTEQLLNVLRDERQVIEAANVVAGFNFANRVADALDVEKEIPIWLERHRFFYSLAITIVSQAMRLRMNFVRRNIGAEDPIRRLAILRDRFKTCDMGDVPPYFDRIIDCPHILGQHAAVQESLLLTNIFPRYLIYEVGLLICALNFDWLWALNWESLLKNSGAEPCLIASLRNGQVPRNRSPFELDLLLLARQITVDACHITDSAIDRLRYHALNDRQVLAWVLIVAGFNAANRLDLALCGDCVPAEAQR